MNENSIFFFMTFCLSQASYPAVTNFKPYLGMELRGFVAEIVRGWEANPYQQVTLAPGPASDLAAAASMPPAAPLAPAAPAAPAAPVASLEEQGAGAAVKAARLKALKK